MATSVGRNINGVDVDELRQYIDRCAIDAGLADRNPEVIARWVGGTRAEVASKTGGPPVYMGGPEDPSAMGMLLRTLAACDVEVVVNTASLLGVEIEDLSIEATGYFNVKQYLGLPAESDAAYQRASYTVRLKTRGATPQQLAAIREAVRDRSPVGQTLERSVPVSVDFEAS